MPIHVLVEEDEVDGSIKILGVLEYEKGRDAKKFVEEHAPGRKYRLIHMYLNDIDITKRF